MTAANKACVYDPRVFDVADIHSAKAIILTPERVHGTDERWTRETPHLLDLMRGLDLCDRSLVLDYGCGIGRLSKALIGRHGCRVIGADISTSMRALAPAYVDSSRFFACHPDMIEQFCGAFDATIAVWVLQHTLDLEAETARIAKALKPGGLFFVVNEAIRVVPTDVGWVNDGLDTKAVLTGRFDLVSEGRLDPVIVTNEQSDRTFWAIYRKR